MPYYFDPPVNYLQPVEEIGRCHPLWSRVRFPVFYTITKLTNGSYIRETEHNPDRADVAVVYEGGHRFTVDDTEATALTAAGYGANLTEVP